MGILNRLQLWWNWLTTDPLGFALYLLYFAVSVLLTLILHEIAHGYVAYRCGDPTAKMLGRLSLDPRKHLDPIGTLCLVFLGFGWAKPVGSVSLPPYSKPTLSMRSPFCKSPMRSTSSPRGRRCAVAFAFSIRVNRAPSLTSPQTGQSVKS